jgi:hypothetical protein
VTPYELREAVEKIRAAPRHGGIPQKDALSRVDPLLAFIDLQTEETARLNGVIAGLISEIEEYKEQEKCWCGWRMSMACRRCDAGRD